VQGIARHCGPDIVRREMFRHIALLKGFQNSVCQRDSGRVLAVLAPHRVPNKRSHKSHQPNFALGGGAPPYSDTLG
jgi:hypothetical protein